MINISRNSWHYRMNDEVRDACLPHNLCPYIRFTASTMIQVAFMLIIVLFCGFCAGHFVQVAFTSSEFDLIALVGGFIWFIAALITSINVGCNNAERIKHTKVMIWMKKPLEKINDGYYAEREPSLVVEWIKAKHEKICPQLNFLDKDDNTTGME